MSNLDNYIFLASKLSKLIDSWNDKLDALAAKYMDSPWFGCIMLAVLFLFAYWGIKTFSSK